MELFARLQDGDSSAATRIFSHYTNRLIQLARQRLTQQLSARVDADDVVMSAYRSFFVGTSRGQFSIADSGDLWRLLVQVTLHKLYRQVQYHQRQKRDVRLEAAGQNAVHEHELSTEPSAQAAVIAAEELRRVMAALPAAARETLELRLRGNSIAEIAANRDVNEKTVRRHLQKAREAFVEQLPAESQMEPKGNRQSREVVSPEADRSGGIDYSELTLLNQVGQGTTGKIYRARWKANGSLVGVKFLRKKLSENVSAVQRFEQEAATLQAIHHTGIVRLFGWGITPHGGRFLVMEYLPLGDLRQRVRQQHASVRESLGWVLQVAEAIQVAHKHGVVHCDLKPANVLLRAAADNTIGVPQAVLTDFGFARFVEGAAKVAMAGTPAFMAPEQIDPFWGKVGPHTDVYGIGALLLTLLTGEPPVRGADAVDVMSQISSGMARPQIGHFEGLPDRIRESANASLAPHTSDRPALEDVIVALRAGS